MLAFELPPITSILNNPSKILYDVGFATFSICWCSLMQRVNEKLRALERKFFGKDSPIRVAIVGCGYSGVELAATISERLQASGVVQAINVEKTILPNAPPTNRETALKVRHICVIG